MMYINENILSTSQINHPKANRKRNVALLLFKLFTNKD